MKYLWDTNTAIYYLQQQFTPNAEKYIDSTLQNGSPYISAITEIELLCWKTATPSDLEIIQLFILWCHVVELEQSVKLKTADLRKTHSIKLPDAIIAASAMVKDLSLITRNTTDFNKIPQLMVIDPFKSD